MRASAYFSSLNNKPDAAKAFGPEPEIAFVMWGVFITRYSFKCLLQLTQSERGWKKRKSHLWVCFHQACQMPLGISRNLVVIEGKCVDWDRVLARVVLRHKQKQSNHTILSHSHAGKSAPEYLHSAGHEGVDEEETCKPEHRGLRCIDPPAKEM